MEKKKSKKSLALILVIAACGLSVPCAGVIAAVGLPAGIGYIRRSKVAEARTNLRLLGDAVADHCRRNGRLPPPAGPLPAVPTSERQAVSFATDPVFAELGFAPIDPVYYRYSIVDGPAGTVEVYAEGDLDGDGALSRFTSICYASCECFEAPVQDELE
jgi:hypothetical protein